jgi:hypothetical protein
VKLIVKYVVVCIRYGIAGAVIALAVLTGYRIGNPIWQSLILGVVLSGAVDVSLC